MRELRKAYAGFHEEVRMVLDACPDCHKWAILEREPLPRWSDGRVALLGDACHPMTPYMASGAAMALEDAVVLARCLDYAGGDVDSALHTYEAIRRPRASVVQAGWPQRLRTAAARLADHTETATAGVAAASTGFIVVDHSVRDRGHPLVK